MMLVINDETTGIPNENPGLEETCPYGESVPEWTSTGQPCAGAMFANTDLTTIDFFLHA